MNVDDQVMWNLNYLVEAACKLAIEWKASAFSTTSIVHPWPIDTYNVVSLLVTIEMLPDYINAYH